MKIKNLKKIKLRAGFAVFVLFFGIALLEAFRNKDWITAGFWVVMALAFLVLDNWRSHTGEA